jgi:WD40 repeat protein
LLLPVLIGIAVYLTAAWPATPPQAGKAAADRMGDPLPAGALMRLGTVRFRHEAAVVQVAFSRDGKTLASASLDGTVRLWEAATGKELQRFAAGIGLQEFPYFGGTLTFSADGKTLTLARYSLYVWDLTAGKEVQHADALPANRPHDNALSAHFTAGGRILVAVNRDPTLRLVDALTGKEFQRFDHLGRVNFVSFSPDGRTLVALKRDNQGKETLHLNEIATGKERAPPIKMDWCHAVVFAPDGRSLAISADRGVRLLDWPSGKELRHWEGHSGALAFSRDGKTLAVGSNQTVYLWSTATGEKLRPFSSFQWVESIAFSPDGKTLAVGTGSYMHRLHPTDDQCGGVIHLWDTTTGQRLGPKDAHQDVALCVAYAPDGKTLASGSRDRTVRLWDPATGKALAVWAGHEDQVLAVAFGPGGKLLASGSQDKTVCVWDTATGQKIHRLQHEGGVYGVTFSGDGTMLATADGLSARLWNARTGKQLHQWKARKQGGVYAVAFAADGKTLAWSGGQRVFLPDDGDNDVHLVDPVTGKEKGLLPGRMGDFAVCSLAFSPSGEQLATGHMNPYLCLWQPATGKLQHKIEARAEGTVTFSTDGKWLAATGPLGDEVDLYEPTTGKKVREIRAGQGGVYAVAFAPDGRALASAGQNGTILIWDLAGVNK